MNSNKIGIFALVGVCILAAWQGRVEAAEGSLRIGVIHIQKVFEESARAKEQRKAIEQSFKRLEDDIRVLEAQIQRERERITQDMNGLDSGDEATRQEDMLNLQILQVRLKRKITQFDNLRRSSMTQYWKSIYDDFQTAVKLIATEYKYDLIITAPNTDLSKELLDTKSPEAVMNKILLSNIQYVSGRVDITQAVVQTMDNIYKRSRSTAP